MCVGGSVMKYFKSLILIIPLFVGIIGSNISDIKEFNNKKGVYYDNFNYTDNVILEEVDGTNIDYNAQLTTVGDYYEITFDVINDSNIDVEISDCIFPNDDKYIEYKLTYADGKAINTGDILKQGENKRIKYRVLYKNQVNEDNYQFDSSFSIGYEQVL